MSMVDGPTGGDAGVVVVVVVTVTATVAAMLALSFGAASRWQLARPAHESAETAQGRSPPTSGLAPQIYAVRFHPGEEIVSSLAKFVKDKELRAASILTCVGSLAGAKLRLALASPGNPGAPLTCLGAHEIVSMVGTLGEDGMHVHASLADANGTVYGGHLMAGGVVHTTVELVVCEAPHLEFRRAFDRETGYKEFQVRAREGPS